MMLTLIFAGFLVFLMWAVMTTDPPPIAGVYRQPGKWYWLKYCAFFVLFHLRKWQNLRRKSVDGQDSGWGMRSRSSVEDMDRAQPLPKDQPLAVDAVYFNGADRHGTYLVMATARRHHGLVQTLLYLRIPGIGLLELPSFPDTSLYTQKELSYSAGGIEITPVKAMKHWKLSFSGKLRLVTSPDQNEGFTEEVHVSFALDWKAAGRYFDFDTDMHWRTICSAMAREKWTSHFFDQLKVAHQTHHEQFGNITGTVHIDTYGAHQLDLHGVRDHSYGNIRDWSDLHRYGIQYLHLADGTDVCMGMICMPRTLSRLPMGYVIKPDGSLHGMTSTDFELHKFGENGDAPKDWECNFTTDENTYNLKGHVIESPIFYIGENWEARIHERMCKFTVNGVPGWGISEWNYRNKTGKPDLYRRESPSKF